jgi:uncharacterized protein YcfJ
MRANSKLFVSALIAATFSAGAAQAGGFRDTAMVVSSTPVYESVNTPQRDCWTEQTGYEDVRRERSYGGALLGGIVGGLLGNTIGKGSGRSVATAVGAATGAIAGDNIDNDGHEYQAQGPARPRYEQRCRTVDNWTRQLTGYNVVYRYQGHEYTTFLTQDPGRSVKVNVDVSLAERY